MNVQTKYDLGDTVTLKHDIDKIRRMITAINVNGAGVSYCLAYGDYEAYHFEMEMDKVTEPFKKKVGFQQ